MIANGTLPRFSFIEPSWTLPFGMDAADAWQNYKHGRVTNPDATEDAEEPRNAESA